MKLGSKRKSAWLRAAFLADIHFGCYFRLHMYRSTSWVLVVLLLALMSTAFDGSTASYTARKVLTKRPGTASPEMVPAVEFEITREKKFPARALDPVLHVGKLDITEYRYANLSNTTLVFTCFEPEKLEDDVVVYVQYGDDPSSRTDFPNFRLKMDDEPLRAPADTVAVVGAQNEKLLPLNPEARRKIAELALELLRSADYEAVRPLAKKRWDAERQAPHLHLAFEPPRNASFRFSTTGPAKQQQVQVMEMIIPFNERSGPDYLFVRDGKRVRAFAKFKPRQLEALRRTLAESTPGGGQAYWPRIDLQ